MNINPLNHKIQKELNKIAEYFINEPLLAGENVGLYTGISGECLFMAQNYLVTKDEKYLSKCNEYLDYLVTHIDEGKDIIWSFSSGIAGSAWLIEYLAGNNIIDSDTDEILDEIDDLLFLRMQYLMTQGDMDLLNGALGIGKYFLKRKKYQYVELLIDHLNDNKVADDNEIKWKKKKVTESFFTYDFSLAHGSAGIIHFLSASFDLGIKKETCLLLIEGSISFLLNNVQDFSKTGSYFPSLIACEIYQSGKNAEEASRVAWCYGDLGILYTLFETASMLKDTTLTKFATSGLLNVSKRSSFEQTRIIDAGFCHGASGAAYIFFKMWLKTKNNKFYDATIYWIEKTLEFGNDSEGIEGYKFLVGNMEGRFLKTYKPLLEGVIGVAILLINFLNPELTDWDQCMMLSS